MIVVYGTRLYGSVDKCGESRIATRFFHVYFLPLIPLGSQLILEVLGEGRYRTLPLGLHLRSTLIGYARAWLPVMAFGFLISAFASWSRLEVTGYSVALSVTLMAALVTAMAGLAWLRFGRLSDEVRAQRLVYGEFTGTPADPELLGEARERLRERLHTEVSLKAPELAATSYRAGVGPGTDWIDLALDPTIRDRNYLAASFTLSRLESSLATEAEKARWNHRHVRLWHRLKEIDPSVISLARKV